MATFRSLNSTASGTRTNTTVTKPTGLTAGDRLVFAMTIETDVTPTMPAGWELGVNIDSVPQAVDLWVWSKIADSTDAAAASFTATHASSWTNAACWAVQSPSSLRPHFSIAAQGNTTSTVARSATTLGANAYVAHILGAFDNMGALTAPTGFTERYDSATNLYVSDQTKASAGATGDAAVTIGGTTLGWAAVQMVIEDAATTTGTPNPYVVMPGVAALAASRSPSVTFGGYTPLENDVVVFFPSSTDTATITVPSGWVNPLTGTVDVESDSHQLCAVYHLVTSSEASGGTTTYTATNLYDTTETGNVTACVLRNVDTSTPLDIAASTFNSGNTITPHVLAGLTPTQTDSIVVSAVAKDATGAYTTEPSGWEWICTSNTNQGKALLVRDALTASGVAVAATNITPSAGDEYASITLAFAKVVSGGGGTSYALSAAGAGASTGALAAQVSAAFTATGTGASAGSLAVDVVPPGPVSYPLSAAGTGTSTGTAAITRTTTASSTGTGTTTGSAAITRTTTATASGTGTSAGSLTVSASLAASAAGTGTTTGSATVARTTGLSATGTGATTGGLNVEIQPPGPVDYSLSATGNTHSTAGTITVVGTLAVGATGTGTTVGTAAVATLRPITAAGTSTSVGSVVVGAVLTFTATGVTISAGSVVVTNPSDQIPGSASAVLVGPSAAVTLGGPAAAATVELHIAVAALAGPAATAVVYAPSARALVEA